MVLATMTCRFVELCLQLDCKEVAELLFFCESLWFLINSVPRGVIALLRVLMATSPCAVVSRT